MAEKGDSRLVIHTSIRPDEGTDERKKAGFRLLSRRKRPKTRGEAGRRRRARARRRLSMSERLMRNSAIACALLLGILALGNVDAPWAKGAVRKVEEALTMRIDLDDSLGQLSFVRRLMPESALVFFNTGKETEFARPVSGDVRHPWSESQPWLLFECGEGEEVRAAYDGAVTAVSELSGGGWGLIVDHGDGLESVYAYLSRPEVKAGDAVERGDALAMAMENGSAVYYELRRGGTAIDPGSRMGL